MKKILVIILLVFSLSYTMETKPDTVDTIKITQVKKATPTKPQPKTNWSKIKDLFM